MKAAILTLSDRGARGERADESGPALVKWLEEHGVKTLHAEVIPDDEETIVVKLMGWADSNAFDLILTTGGTGVSPRDVTPDATLRVLNRGIPIRGQETILAEYLLDLQRHLYDLDPIKSVSGDSR